MLPQISKELKISPFIKAIVDTIYTLNEASDEDMNPDLAVTIMEHIGYYLTDLTSEEKGKFKSAILELEKYAKKEKWQKEHVRFLKTFYDDMSID